MRRRERALVDAHRQRESRVNQLRKRIADYAVDAIQQDHELLRSIAAIPGGAQMVADYFKRKGAPN